MFLAFGSRMPPFLKSKFRCLPPLPARRACHGSTWYDCKASQVCGRFLPHQRANVDQVPLPFVNDMKETLDEKGADRVTINQNGPALGKRQATGQVCFSRLLSDRAFSVRSRFLRAPRRHAAVS